MRGPRSVVRPSNRKRRRRAVVTALAALALATSVCVDGRAGLASAGAATSPATNAMPSVATSAAPRSTPSGVDWTGCGERLECARVPVPLDWADPTGEQIEL